MENNLIIVECEDINAWIVDETDLKVIHTVKKYWTSIEKYEGPKGRRWLLSNTLKYSKGDQNLNFKKQFNDQKGIRIFCKRPLRFLNSTGKDSN